MKTVLPVHPSVVVVSVTLAHCPCFELDCAARGKPLGNQWPRDFLHKDGQPKNYLVFLSSVATSDSPPPPVSMKH